MNIVSPAKGARAVEQAYDFLKNAILSGEFTARMHLREGAIATQLGLSRTPVREAFRRLGAEGWLEITPNAGAKVAEWSPRDIEEVFEVRMLIESRVAGRAAQRATEAQIERLRALAEQMSVMAECPVDKVLDERSAVNAQFHDLLVEAAGSQRLKRLLDLVVEIPMVKWVFGSYQPAEVRRSAAHHHEIVAAVEAHDAEWASAAMKSHILSAHHAVMRRLRELDGLPKQEQL
ncbi:MAG: GntR family transcriptional regulator [Alphaproteobacteria bacterium]|nr:GntR family transcriptional regulator [Alphaproteobacteria bacterium]